MVLGAAKLGMTALEQPPAPEAAKAEALPKLMHLEGVHARHASVPDSLLMKGTMTNDSGWSPAHDRAHAGGLNKAAPLAESGFKHATSNKVMPNNMNAAAIKKQGRPPASITNSQQPQTRSADEESVDYDSSLENTSVSSFDFNRERAGQPQTQQHLQQQQHLQHQQQQLQQQQQQQQQQQHRPAVLHKAAPSKWDDAEKWLSSDPNSGRNSKQPRMQQLVSNIPNHVIINASKKAALLGRMAALQGKSGSAVLDFLAENGLKPDDLQDAMCTKKIEGPYRFSFMPSPGLGAATKARSMSSLDRYPLEELLEDGDKLKVVSLCDEAEDKPALRTEKPTSDFAGIDGLSMSSKDEAPNKMLGSPAASARDTASYVAPPGLRSVSMRDMGTEMTPIASQEPSRTGTPLRATTPTIRSPVSSRPSTPGRATSPLPSGTNKQHGNAEDSLNRGTSGTDTPVADAAEAAVADATELSEKQLQAKTRQEIRALGTQLGKASIAAWASREEEEADASRCLKNRVDLEEAKKNVVEARATAWEEAEKAKYEARYKREESKIIAWENHERAKAEAEMRRIEVKVERMRSHSHEQLMNKLASARRKAEELRAVAESRMMEQATKTKERAQYIRQTGNMPPPPSSSSSPLTALLRSLCS